MTPPYFPFESILDDLCRQGYAICEDFLPVATLQILTAEAKAQQASGHLTAAKVGQHKRILNAEIRNDAIAWLQENQASAGVNIYFEQMQALKRQINQSLFMGLHELEAHFAIYPAGGSYQKHLDQFKGGSTMFSSRPRQLSSVLYLNEDWQTSDGGALRLYLDEIYLDKKNTLDILPTAGKLVLFLSGRFWHEVLPAKRERISIAGWFK